MQVNRIGLGFAAWAISTGVVYGVGMATAHAVPDPSLCNSYSPQMQAQCRQIIAGEQQLPANPAPACSTNFLNPVNPWSNLPTCGKPCAPESPVFQNGKLVNVPEGCDPNAPQPDVPRDKYGNP
jgi:hypothetical protein